MNEESKRAYSSMLARMVTAFRREGNNVERAVALPAGTRLLDTGEGVIKIDGYGHDDQTGRAIRYKLHGGKLYWFPAGVDRE